MSGDNPAISLASANEVTHGSFTTTANSIVNVLAFPVIAVVAVMAVYQFRPPSVAPASAPAAEFSAERAMKHLAVIAEKSRPIGSPEHARIRDYIVSQLAALQLQPEIQKTTVVNQKWGALLPAAMVENVVARLAGTENSRAILIAAHYDSMPNSPGAGDDGSAVAAMLETLRALKSGPAQKNDVIFLFTDGEEVGLLGAKAFVEQHSWSKDVGLVLNFEARGTGGPTLMFETSTQNRWLIKRFSEATPHPIASSYMYDIYKRMPNNTDFSVFKEAGFAGLNFAFINGSNCYHAACDNLEHFDQRSLQHHGSYMLALTRSFGSLNLKDTKNGEAAYFDIFGLAFVHYPAGWVPLITILVVVMFIGVAVLGWTRNRLTLRGVVAGFLLLMSGMIGSAVIAMLLWFIISTWESANRFLLFGDGGGSKFLLLSFAATTIAITSVLYNWFAKKLSGPDQIVGALLWWLIAMLATTVYLPGGAYLFTWPLLFTLMSLGFIFLTKNQETVSFSIIPLSIGVITGVVLLVPTIYANYIGLGLRLAWVLMVIVVLLLGLLIPHFNLLAARKRWLVSCCAALIALILVIAGSLTIHSNSIYPKPNSVFYLLNADSGKALWASFDERPDAWTSQFFANGATKASLAEYLPSASGEYLQSPAPVAALAFPKIILLDDRTSANVRKLSLRIISVRQAPVISIFANKNTEVLAAEVNGKPIEKDIFARLGNRFSMRFYGLPDDGIKLDLQLKPNKSVEIKAMDHSYGLTTAGASLKDRPSDMMPTPILNYIEDSTIVSKSYIF